MLTQSEKETFQSRGLIRVQNFLPSEKVALARKATLDHLEKEGIRRDGAWYLDEFPPSSPFNASAKLIKGLKLRRAVMDLIAEEAAPVIGDLLDGRPTVSLGDAQVLFTLPNAAEWIVPSRNWHLDLPRFPDGVLPGVQIFTFLDTVVPGGGGTLVVAGSHRLVNENRRVSSQQVKRILHREPYFRELMSEAGDRKRFLAEPGYVGEVELQLAELHGEPGDVFFTDLRLLHTIAPNAAKSPRIMLTQRFLLELLREANEGHV